ncbi:MAG: B12-binding domain-containing radical SAM protein [Candidatus Aminicenantes bacterium]|nr:B12-binding domain-containing radical SAM protein [Candidatus Aminicenantes bacterium]
MRLHQRIKEPKILLLYPQQQFQEDEHIRPEGTLGIPYLHASLKQAGYYVDILDTCVGNRQDSLDDTFYKQRKISENIVRIGLSESRILAEVEKYDIIGISSIFTQQTECVFDMSNLIRKHFPGKILLAGGVNARNLKEHFFNNSFDIVFLSEAEKSIVQVVSYFRSGKPALKDIPGISFRYDNKTVKNISVEQNAILDSIPMPSWSELPNDKYWEIGRIWGGRTGWLEHEKETCRYAAVLTSRGCSFNCDFCHVSLEKDEEAGKIGRLRYHSVERVHMEFQRLKEIGINTLFINDESFLMNKKRVYKIFAFLKKMKFKVADVNGVNIVNLFRKIKGRYVVDDELVCALYEAGFRKISLPFETGNQRILDKYCSKKWNLEKHNVIELVKKLREAGISADGNFMIGWPDETLEELTNTYLLARDLMQSGLIGCGFYFVQPYPGSRLHRMALAAKEISEDWDWNKIGWSKGTPYNKLKYDKSTLKYTWSLVWKLLNPSSRVHEISQQLLNK